MSEKPSYKELELRVKKLEKEINDCARSEKELKRLLLAVDQSSGGIAICDLDGNIKYINKTFAEIHGYLTDELIGKNLSIFHTPEQMPSVEEANLEIKQKGSFKGEIWHAKRDGNVFPTMMHNSLIRDETDKPIGLMGTLRDITDIRLAEKALKDSQEFMHSVFESIQDGISVLNPDLSIRHVNGVMKGWYADNLPLEGRKCFECYHNANKPCYPCPTLRCLESGKTEMEIVAGPPDSDTNWLEVYSYPIRNPETEKITGIVEFVRDITEQKHVEEMLKESESRYRSVFDNAATATVILEEDKIISMANHEFEKLSGYSKEEVEGNMAWPEFVVPEDFEMMKKYHRVRRQKGEKIPREYEFRFVDRVGNIKYIYNKVQMIPETKRSIASLTDLTQMKRTEKALQESEEKFRNLAEHSPNMIFINKKGKVVYANSKCQKIIGCGRDEFYSPDFDFMSLIAPDSVERVRSAFSNLMNGEELPPYEFTLLTKDGKRIEALVSTGLIQYEGDISILGVISDITERKQAEEALRESEKKLARLKKMESLGLMAGGIAHDLNNILLGIVGYPDLLLLQLPDDSPLRRHIESIKESGMRAADVVSDLLTVAKGIAIVKKVSNLNVIIEEYLNSVVHKKLKTSYPSVIFKTVCDPGLFNVNCSPTHIEKSLMNLVLNAAEAIESNGTVTISTANRYLDEPLKGYESIRTGEYVVLSVSDDGLGISSEDIERIFEPFYTKKVMERSGTGLGLTIVWNTIQDHEGYINVNSGEKGTIFELYFPITREEISAAIEDVSIENYLGYGEHILVIDDEKNQREIACGFLTELGYDAKMVSSGEKAIEYVKKRSVDLIILDMIMPNGMNGLETYKEIINIHPGQKAVIASGFSVTADVKTTQKLGAGKYLKKPYTIEKMGLAVKEELTKKPS